MDKRYQVFVSSTYADLQDERKEVMQALLELDCIPSGMELFPAANEESWELIKKVVDDCDYYVLIIGGRYGSTDSDGIGFTEKEYKYAVEKKKPIIAFLHGNPGKIETDKSEGTDAGKIKLNNFRQLIETNRQVKYWNNANELGSEVSRSMIKLIKTCPAIGWIKADRIASEESMQEIFRLRNEVENLKEQIKQLSTQAPTESNNLSQGNDIFRFPFYYRYYHDYKWHRQRVFASYSWNIIFSTISPHLVDECSEADMKKYLVDFIKKEELPDISTKKENSKYSDHDIAIIEDEFQTIKVQFKALGLIEKSKKQHSLKVTDTYWKLTVYGEHVMTQLRAIRKKV